DPSAPAPQDDPPGPAPHDNSAGSHVITNAPELIVTVGPVITIIAPFPFEIVIPTSLTMIIAPVAVFIRMPPAGPGRSEIWNVTCAAVCMNTDDSGDCVANASAGTSAAEPYQHPDQIG